MRNFYLDGPGTTGAITVGTTASEAKVSGSILAERKAVLLQPIDGDIYWSYDSGLTTSTGHLIPQGTLMYVSTGELLPIHLIAGSNIDVRISEVS